MTGKHQNLSILNLILVSSTWFSQGTKITYLKMKLFLFLSEITHNDLSARSGNMYKISIMRGIFGNFFPNKRSQFKRLDIYFWCRECFFSFFGMYVRIKVSFYSAHYPAHSNLFNLQNSIRVPLLHPFLLSRIPGARSSSPDL